ncbi:MAG: hypothetical protein ACXADS_10335 [Candidatus Thorarchaeota archaeon]|jgi:hypothetical protein
MAVKSKSDLFQDTKSIVKTGPVVPDRITRVSHSPRQTRRNPLWFEKSDYIIQ